MTTVTAAKVGLAPRLNPGRARRLRAAVASEWVKLWSVRATPAVLVLLLVSTVVVAALVCGAASGNWPHMPAEVRAEFDPTERSLRGLEIGNVLLGILGVLVVGTEYGSGLIRTTFAATPQRGLVLAAKVLSFTATAWAGATITCLAAFLVGQATLSGSAPHATLDQPGVLRAVLGAGAYLTLVGLLGLALSALLRRTAAALGVLFTVVFVLPFIVTGLPDSIQTHVLRYLPPLAGQSLYSVVRNPNELSPGAGLAFLIAYAAVTLAAATVLVRRRDA